MTEDCENCGAQISDGGVFKSANAKISQAKVAFVNFVEGMSYEGLCEKCDGGKFMEAKSKVTNALYAANQYISSNVSDFPLFTFGNLPNAVPIRLIGMVTANVSVGTGFFNEFSQGFSDFFGATNTTSGMAYKVNSGETTARSLLVGKAVALGANCVIAVDIDYGSTANNAATVNMQGTAAVVEGMDLLLTDSAYGRAQKLYSAIGEGRKFKNWLAGRYPIDERADFGDFAHLSN